MEHLIGDTHASSVPAATPGLGRPLELSVLSPTPCRHTSGGLAGAGQCGRLSLYWHLQSGVKERGIPCRTEAGGEAGPEPSPPLRWRLPLLRDDRGPALAPSPAGSEVASRCLCYIWGRKREVLCTVAPLVGAKDLGVAFINICHGWGKAGTSGRSPLILAQGTAWKVSRTWGESLSGGAGCGGFGGLCLVLRVQSRALGVGSATTSQLL